MCFGASTSTIPERKWEDNQKWFGQFALLGKTSICKNSVLGNTSLLKSSADLLEVITWPFFMGEVFQFSDPRGPPLYLLQQLHILHVLGAPDLDALLHLRSKEDCVEGDNYPPRSSGHLSFHADQDTDGLPSCKITLLASVMGHGQIDKSMLIWALYRTCCILLTQIQNGTFLNYCASNLLTHSTNLNNCLGMNEWSFSDSIWKL